MIKIIFVVALVGYSFQVMMSRRDDMIFGFYQGWLVLLSETGKLGKYIAKPLGLCIICNTTWIGLITALFIFNLSFIFSLIIAISAAGLANFIMLLHHYFISHLS
jgi:hypothetical protein